MTSTGSVQWYNAALRIPTLIGKLPSGEQIWGGPYRMSQAVAGCSLMLAAFATRGVWGPLIAGSGLVGMLTTLMVCIGVGVLAGWGAGRLPLGSNPLLEAATATTQVLRSSAGTWCGSPLRVGAAYQLRGPRVLHLPQTGPQAPKARHATSNPTLRPDVPAPVLTTPPATSLAATPAEKLAALLGGK